MHQPKHNVRRAARQGKGALGFINDVWSRPLCHASAHCVARYLLDSIMSPCNSGCVAIMRTMSSSSSGGITALNTACTEVAVWWCSAVNFHAGVLDRSP